MKRSHVFIVLLTLAVFAGVLAQVTFHLRGHIRAQVLGQKALLLEAVAEREVRSTGRPLLELVLDMVDMEEVVGVRLFDETGVPLAALPESLSAGSLDPATHDQAGPQCTWMPHTYLDTLYADPFARLSSEPVPLLQIAFPVREETGRPVAGYVEFLLDGLSTQAAFNDLDRGLLQQSLAAFTAGGMLILGILWASFLRLERKNRDLARANQELTLHAKTAVLGALSFHLFHGLKNVLAGLNLAMEQRGGNREEALTATRRLQGMVGDVVGMIRDQETGLAYQLSAEEVLHLALERGKDLSKEYGVRLTSICGRNSSYCSVEANLLILSLENLIHNAIEASPQGGVVLLALSDSGPEDRYTVTDQGAGIPEERQAGLFQAGVTTKDGGSGLGLCISRQLCRHLGGELSLQRTGEDGTVFEIMLPHGSSGQSDVSTR